MKFLNATQHTLTDAQRAAAQKLPHNWATENNDGFVGVEFIELRDANPELFAEISNCPSDRKAVKQLARRFGYFLVESQFDYIHLPIGSPAFQFELGVWIGDYVEGGGEMPRVIFSHSVRESVDETQPDGSVLKRAVFKFEEFI